MLTVLPYSRSDDRSTFKSYSSPRSTMAFPYNQAQTSTTSTTYYPNSYTNTNMAQSMSRPDMTSAMCDYSQQQSFQGQWNSYSINSMLKKPEYLPNGLQQTLDMKNFSKHFLADSTTENQNQAAVPVPVPSTPEPQPNNSPKEGEQVEEKPKEVKKRVHSVPDSMKDESYYDRRKKNNESARRSRENRRAKEEHVTMRMAFLEHENIQLKTEVNLLKADVERLSRILHGPQKMM